MEASRARTYTATTSSPAPPTSTPTITNTPTITRTPTNTATPTITNTPIGGCSINYPNFASTVGLALVGGAAQAGNVLRLTTNSLSQTGSAWYNSTVNVYNGFNATFQFQLSDFTTGGADGFSFNVHQLGTSALVGEQGTNNYLSVQFDTYQNPELGDPSDNFVRINYLNNSLATANLNTLGIVLKDGLVHTVSIASSRTNLQVSIDSTPVASASGMDLGAMSPATVGFGARTGGASERHDILNWSFTCVAGPTPTVTRTPTVSSTPTITNTPTPTFTSTPTRTPAICSGGHRILIVHADTAPNTLRNALLALSGIGAVDTFYATPATPTLAQLQQYDTVVVISNATFADPTALGNNLADFEDGGGVVVVFNWVWAGDGRSIQGRWLTGGYSPFNMGGTPIYTNCHLGAHDSNHPLMQGVSDLWVSNYRMAVSLASGATQVASWACGAGDPLVAFKGQTVGLSAYVGDGPTVWTGEYPQVILNAANWLHPCVNPTATATPTNTPTNTFIPTNTPIPTSTSSPTDTSVPSNTPTSTATSTDTPTDTPTNTSTPTSTPTETSTPTDTPTSIPPTDTPTDTPTNTPISTPTNTPAGVIVGHVTWQGITQPNTRNDGITATLSLCVGGVPTNYTVTTDVSGYFTLTTGLPNGSYNWRVKGLRNLANSGTLSLAGSITNQEMGTMRAGDCDNNNAVTVQDFSILRNTFGKGSADPGYDQRADFNRDNTISVNDFNSQKSNFGQSGASLTCP